MKLTTRRSSPTTGLMQGCTGAGEDRRGGFERGGWAMGLFGQEVMRFVNAVFHSADAFLFGRWTYELFAVLGREGRS